jgi:hypothetical protein
MTNGKNMSIWMKIVEMDDNVRDECINPQY